MHSNRYLVTLPTGGLSIIQLNCDDGDPKELEMLAKTLFELSRDGSDMVTHFDPAIHTIVGIDAGIPSHVPLSYRVCKDTNLPKDRTNRDHWEDTGTEIQVNTPKS